MKLTVDGYVKGIVKRFQVFLHDLLLAYKNKSSKKRKHLTSDLNVYLECIIESILFKYLFI